MIRTDFDLVTSKDLPPGRIHDIHLERGLIVGRFLHTEISSDLAQDWHEHLRIWTRNDFILRGRDYTTKAFTLVPATCPFLTVRPVFHHLTGEIEWIISDRHASAEIILAMNDSLPDLPARVKLATGS